MAKQKTIKTLFSIGMLVLGLFMFAAVTKAEGEIQITETGKDRLRDIITDGEGGAILGWVNGNNPDPEDYGGYVQKINRNGEIKWKKGGVKVNKVWNWNYKMNPDGKNGAILIDGDSSDDYYFIQRIAKDGKLKWSENGIAIPKKEGDYYISPLLPQTFLPDGNGGAYIFFKMTNLDSNIDANEGSYMQHILSNGDLEFNNTIGEKLTFDLSDNAFIVFVQEKNGKYYLVGNYYIEAEKKRYYFIQKRDKEMDVKWTVPLPLKYDGDDGQKLFIDSVGGMFLIVDQDGSNLPYFRINSSGELTSGPAPKTLDLAVNQYSSLWAVDDGDANMLVVWLSGGGGKKIFAQKINKEGELMWNENKQIKTSSDLSKADLIINEIGNDYMLFWHESVNWQKGGISLLKIDGNANLLWPNEIPATGMMPKNEIGNLLAVEREGGGAFMAWGQAEAGTSGGGEIYALGLDEEGKIIQKVNPVYRIAYLSKKGKKTDYYNFKKQLFKLKIKKFSYDDRTYWTKLTPVKKETALDIDAFTKTKVGSYLKTATNLNAIAANESKFKFNLSFNYKKKDLKKSGLKENDLALYYYNTETKNWAKLSRAKQNKKKNEFVVTYSYFKSPTNYFVIGEK